MEKIFVDKVIVEKVKAKIKEHAPELLFIGTTISTLAFFYLYGKTKGAVTFELYLKPSPSEAYQKVHTFK